MNALDRWRAANNGYDSLGRQQPRRQGIADYLRLIARIQPARVRRIPTSAIAEEGTDADGYYALLDCPCGGKPVAREQLERCGGCERYYVLVALGSVYVCYGAMSPPPLSGAGVPVIAAS